MFDVFFVYKLTKIRGGGGKMKIMNFNFLKIREK